MIYVVIVPKTRKNTVAIMLDLWSVAIPWILCPDVQPPARRAPKPSKVPPAKNQKIYKMKDQLNFSVKSPIPSVKKGIPDTLADINPPIIIPIMNMKRQLNLSLYVSEFSHFNFADGAMIFRKLPYPVDTPKAVLNK